MTTTSEDRGRSEHFSPTPLPRPRLVVARPPSSLTSMIGREGELAVAGGLLDRDDIRLVTLTGPGGIGKSRLALGIAEQARDAFPDGVAFVSLAPLAEPGLVPGAVARAIGLAEQRSADLVADLCAAMQSARLLLVLDNFEHVAAAATQVVDVLLACPGVKALITSRVRLRLSGEHDVPVPPLDCPDAGKVLDAQEALAYPAVALFETRARAIRSDFAIDDGNAAVVAAICRSLDGLPLAIELAAGRVGVLPPTALLSRLDRRLRLLTGGPRDAPVRLQRMADAIAWSYELLSPTEQALFRRLGVFAGGCTLETALAVSSLQKDDELLDTLTTLIDHSLVRQTEQADGEPRFDLLETIRSFAWRELEKVGEHTETRRRHAACFVELAERAESELTGALQGEWLERLELEHDNIRSALVWLLAPPDHGPDAPPDLAPLPWTRSSTTVEALRLSSAMWRFWDIRGYRKEGRQWIGRALAAADRSDSEVLPPFRAKAFHALGALAASESDFDAAIASYDTALAIWSALARSVEAARTLDHLGTIAFQRSDHGTATRHFEAALQLAREADDERLVATLLHNLGTTALVRGDLATSTAAFAESERMLRVLGDDQALAIVLDNLGVAAFRQGAAQQASAFHEASLDLCRRLGDRLGIGTALNNLAIVCRTRGELERAEAFLDEALQVLREIGARFEEAGALRDLGMVYLERGDLTAAAATIGRGLLVYLDVDAPSGIADCAESLARVQLRCGRPDRAARLLGAAAARRIDAGVPLPEVFRSGHEGIVTAARAALGDSVFEREHEAGRVLSAEEVIAEAALPTGFPQSVAVDAGPDVRIDALLTRREREVLRLLVDGRSDREIAMVLSISPRTASKHVSAILTKLDVESRTAAVAIALKGLLA